MSQYRDKILHVDGDAFFASVERVNYPRLRNQPVVVGEERGIATAATYEAKALGVKRGMPIFQIKKFFPTVTILPTHFELYEKYSRKLVCLLKKFSDQVEVYSIDECFAILDGKEIDREGGIYDFVKKIKAETQKSLGITYSFGAADTKVLAKAASKFKKPDGLTVIEEENCEEVLSKTAAPSVWGIGPRTARKLDMLGVKTALDFASLPISKVSERFAAPLQEVWHELNGKRVFEVSTLAKKYSKSIQSTRTFAPASGDQTLVFSELSKNVENACHKLREESQEAASAYIFLKSSDFKITGGLVHMPYHTNNPSTVLEPARKIFASIFDRQTRYRSTGVVLADLRPKENEQRDLFGAKKRETEKNSFLESVDMIRSRFGSEAIFLASSLKSSNRRILEHQKKHASDPYIYNLPFPYLGEVS